MRDDRLDYIRVTAMLMIFYCHIFLIRGQYVPAFWLNTGVQIFLILSAYLLNGKSFSGTKDVFRFYSKRVYRLLLPMWIYLFAVVAVLLMIRYDGLKLSQVIWYTLGGAAFVKSGVIGLGHFWYVTIILICYLLVPVAAYVSKRVLALGNVAFAGCMAVLYVILLVVMGIWEHPEYGINIWLFLFSYFFYNRYIPDTTNDWFYMKVFVIPATLLNLLRVYFEFFYVFDNSLLYKYYDLVFVTTARGALAFGIFSGLKLLFKNVGRMQGKKVIIWFSAISYEFYLTHQFIELSVYEYIPILRGKGLIEWGVYMIICFILTILNSLLLSWICKKVKIKGKFKMLVD